MSTIRGQAFIISSWSILHFRLRLRRRPNANSSLMMAGTGDSIA